MQELQEVDFFSLKSSDIDEAKNTEMPKPKPASIGRPSKAQAPAPNLLQTLRLTDTTGHYLRDVSAASYTLITTTHKAALYDLKTTMYNTCKFFRDNVVKHRIVLARLADPVTGGKTMRTIALREFAKLIEEYKDLATGYRLWSASSTARMIESEYKIEFFYDDTDSNGNQLTKVSFREIPEEYGSYNF